MSEGTSSSLGSLSLGPLKVSSNAMCKTDRLWSGMVARCPPNAVAGDIGVPLIGDVGGFSARMELGLRPFAFAREETAGDLRLRGELSRVLPSCGRRRRTKKPRHIASVRYIASVRWSHEGQAIFFPVAPDLPHASSAATG